MKNLIFEVETLAINLFQRGFLATDNSLLAELDTMEESCNRYNLTELSRQLGNLSKSLKGQGDKTYCLLTVIKSIDILKKKIGYDQLGGY